jgi:hypothetical protein
MSENWNAVRQKDPKRYISSKDTKMPKIIKPASSTEKRELDVLHGPKTDNPMVIKSHEDSHSCKGKLSSSASFLGISRYIIRN